MKVDYMNPTKIVNVMYAAEGRKAYLAGKSLKDNPYDKEIWPTARHSWKVGYKEEAAKDNG